MEPKRTAKISFLQKGEGDPSLSLVAGVDVLVAHGVVELRHFGLDEDIFVGVLPEVDLRAGDLEGRRRDGGDVLDEEFREPLGGDAVHGAQDDAVAVGVGEMFVDPGPGRQRRIGDLPRGEHHLPVFAVDRVAVVVDAGELVVGPHLLELAVGLQERRMVPEPDVLHGEVVLLQVLRRQILLRRELLLLDLGQAVGKARIADVLLQVGGFGDDLVGNDLKFLDEGGVDPPAQDGHGDEKENRRRRNPPVRTEGEENRGDPGEGVEPHHEFQDPELGGHVGVARAENHPPFRKEEIVEVKPGRRRRPRKRRGQREARDEYGRPGAIFQIRGGMNRNDRRMR